MSDQYYIELFQNHYLDPALNNLTEAQNRLTLALKNPNQDIEQRIKFLTLDIQNRQDMCSILIEREKNLIHDCLVKSGQKPKGFSFATIFSTILVAVAIAVFCFLGVQQWGLNK